MSESTGTCAQKIQTLNNHHHHFPCTILRFFLILSFYCWKAFSLQICLSRRERWKSKFNKTEIAWELLPSWVLLELSDFEKLYLCRTRSVSIPVPVSVDKNTQNLSKLTNRYSVCCCQTNGDQMRSGNVTEPHICSRAVDKPHQTFCDNSPEPAEVAGVETNLESSLLLKELLRG